MGQIIDITGQRFGMLTVIAPTRDKNGRFQWLCKCDCGSETSVLTSNLKQGRTKSCGCQARLGRKKKIELIGQKIGHLTVIEPTEQRQSNMVVWKCLCDCGNYTYVSTGNLSRNHTTSCGCQKYKIIGEKLRLKLLGQRFGRLTVIKELPTENQESIWLCQCDCGNLKEVKGWYLTRGIVSSCGCLKSKGEQKISQILSENNIKYEREKIFDTCLSPTGAPLRFDFYVENKYLIEYDGEQHFLTQPNSLYSQEHIKKIQLYDKIKNDWCKNNQIPLIRIPYIKFNSLTLDDLLWKENTNGKGNKS